MPSTADYKKKYMELRSKYMNDLDQAFRIGFEQGEQSAQQVQAQQAQDAAQQMGSAPSEGDMEPTEQGQPGEQAQEAVSEHPGGSELDQHIAKLESLLGKSEDAEIKKSLQDLISIRKSELLKIELKKSSEAISGIAKALHRPSFKVGVQASHNMSDNAKRAASLQHKIVEDVLKKMESEQTKVSKGIKDILAREGLSE